MTQLVVFPDVTALAIDVISAELDERELTADVASRVPGDRTLGSGPLIVVRSTGGETYDTIFHTAQISVEAWDDDEAQAHDLCQLAVAILRSVAATVVAGTALYKVDITGGPAYSPDPQSEQPRYTVAAALTVRGATI
jgi:hypothetical protein